MSLLLNEEFTLYRLRLGYLNQIHDGVGERLINLNTAVLNEPAFRAAGWVADTAAIKRCYSPPIPTTGAADYFNRPSRVRDNGIPLNDEASAEGRGGLISGQLGSEETVGPSFLTEKERRRRKQGQKIEDDDSSDLSDDSDDEDTAAQSVRFAKMPNRSRSSTSPPRQGTATLHAEQAGPEVKVISPSYRPRTSSLGATEAINAANSRIVTRPRRDTTTSSEMSSDNEGLIPEGRFRRKLPGRPQKSAMLADKIAEEEPDDESELEDEDEEEDVEVAEASDLSDEFEGDDVAVPSPELPIDEALDISVEKRAPPIIPPAVSPSLHTATTRPSKDDLPKLPKLPAGRPMSMKPPASLLSMALKGSDGADTPGKPYQKYAELSGKGEAQPLWIKIYAPFSKNPNEPIQVPLKRAQGAEGAVPTVKELIGLALWRYDEEEYEPALSIKDSKVESWELRMVEDGEVDLDFPALSRDRPVTDFTSNNNRPPQRRMRDKPWDEFGLIRAESRDATSEDDEAAPITTTKTAPIAAPSPALISQQIMAPPPVPPSMMPNRNPITGPAFTLNAAIRKDSTNLMDAPQQQTATSTPRMGPVKTVQVHFTDPQSFQVTLLPLDTTADTYIAELFEKACTRLRLDKALYVFKVKGTQTVAPSDRTVEALGSKLHLDLVRRRFGAVGDFGLGLSGSPGSSSPNAPLELVPNTPPTAKEAKRRKGFPGVGGVLHPLVAQKSEFNSTATSMLDLAGPNAGIGCRYNVMRKLPFSLTTSHPRTLIITPEYMQILPGPPTDEGGQASGSKVTNVSMQSIVGVKVSRKHPKMMRVLVYRDKETKRYDFECASHAEAEQIVGDIRVGLSEYGVGGDDV
ncbi:Component of a membrane-bound complex containing the Tor2p kinase [Recurvomyces mirabilis]|uniref:Component of a membrane-bound complex containing the Tor2p kinase n=1 Tax=Recurvomyces mirabilis TaxID=574656 RepID=A0AAE1C0X1_9PEZI|nr:Component of a membrane-bound complex containing the Tor2p kinase [Recurvomyces mirabilis]KAK5154136.1 Component of a membrane-bound complex containing the Tor2p kinase [Recurvomyces mirabilis]